MILQRQGIQISLTKDRVSSSPTGALRQPYEGPTRALRGPYEGPVGRYLDLAHRIFSTALIKRNDYEFNS